MNQKDNIDQDIDLNYLSSSVNSLLKKTGLRIYGLVLFIKKNIYLLLALLIIGVGTGFYLDKKLPFKLEHSIIVAPNFGSTALLYKTLPSYSFLPEDASKEDKAMLLDIKDLKVEPIKDFYELMHDNRSFFETFAIVSERTGDVNKVIEGEILGRNYRYHQIKFKSLSNKDANKLADFILHHLNNQNYFKERKKAEQANLSLRREQSEESLNQLNKILDQAGINAKLDKAVLKVNEYSNLSALVGTKENVLIELKRLDVLIQESTDVVYEVDRMINVRNKTFFNQYKYIIPIGLFLLFIIVSLFVSFMRKFRRIASEQ